MATTERKKVILPKSKQIVVSKKLEPTGQKITEDVVKYQVKNPEQDNDMVLYDSATVNAKNETELSFKMYPVRCKSCNKPLANLSAKYEQLLEINGGDIKNALDDLDIMRQCCRISMMNPNIITHDITDRSLIEQRTLEQSKPKVIIPLEPANKISLSRRKVISLSEVKPQKELKQLNVNIIPNSNNDEIEVLDVTTYPEGMTRYVENNPLNPDEAGLSQIQEPLQFLSLERDVGCGYKVKVLDNRRYIAQ